MPHLTMEELENIKGKSAIEWVEKQNECTTKRLKPDPNFSAIHKDIYKILSSKDKIPYISQHGEYYYNFWTDESNPNGIWRRTTRDSYLSEDIKWEVLLDLDRMQNKSNPAWDKLLSHEARTKQLSGDYESWVFVEANRLSEDSPLALITLSYGAKDAVVMREFNMDTKSFIEDGFNLAEAKSDLVWLDKDNLLVATDFGDGSLTDSGYARQVKLWNRKESLDNAKLIFECDAKDFLVYPKRHCYPDGITFTIKHKCSFYENIAYLFDPNSQNLLKFNLPVHVDIELIFKNQVLVKPKKDWKVNGKLIKAGSLISIDINNITKLELEFETLFSPTDKIIFDSVAATKNKIFLKIMNNIANEVHELNYINSKWNLTRKLNFPDNGSINIISTNPSCDEIYFNYKSFLTPSTLYRFDGQLSIAKKQLELFDATNLITEQLFATSNDGIKIPYFVIRNKDIVYNGKNPTILYGYGGFRRSLKPSYSGLIGKTWLEKGGVHVIANIRGGGEFGPNWHQVSLKENRQICFDDFASVAKELIARKITSPEHLGIEGASNGGLLVAAVFVQHPELFNAVLCQVPLIDMLRYHKLSAGASWVGEYGDPDNDPKARNAIKKYSPLHNLKPGVKYPEIFATSSTEDDRVHPSHARKLVHAMQMLGHPVLYHENQEGGHRGAANIKQVAQIKALAMTYMHQKLNSPSAVLKDKAIPSAASKVLKPKMR